MTESNKVIKNQLFNASVTGATIEDFTQNAVLFPAQEITPTLIQESTVTHQESEVRTESPHIENVYIQGVDIQQSVDNSQQFQSQQLNFQQQEFPIYNIQPNEFQQQNSSFSSVISSFSNILKFTPQPSGTESESLPAPAGIGNIIAQDSITVSPVPLFSADNANFNINATIPVTTPTIPQGSVNTFRRTGLKKPIYAKLPGLSTTETSPALSNLSQPILSSFPSQTINLENNSLSNYFQPELSAYSAVPNIEDTVIHSNFHSINSTTSSAVMAAIPANEISQTPSVSVSNSDHYSSYEPSSQNILPASQNEVTQNNTVYRPVYHHWFHKSEIEGRVIWQPFSMIDSLALEEAFTSNDLSPEKVVPTDGGRYDVNILRRQRTAVYWKATATEVRRCSWFHKANTDGKYIPYEENIATTLEEEYKIAFESNIWHRRVELPTGETVVFHGHDVLVLFPQSQSPDSWGNTPQNQTRPRVVKRGMDEFDIDEGESAKVDHLLFLVHGIGSVCDLKFRTVEEVVDEFRSISLQLVRSHYKTSCEQGLANRIEVLPISWHEKLHSEDTGIDKKLESITLESIPRLRNFTNDTLLDILFYTSPFYCQTIISHVGTELNRIFELFKQRNPTFNGGVSLGGHSLGSLILFDLLCHQHPETEKDEEEEEEEKNNTSDHDEDLVPPLKCSKPHPLQRRMSRRISYMMGRVGTGQPELHYPHLNFEPVAFFALGSPIGMFVTVRGLDNLGEQFALPTCQSFFNIFHPYDPVAYRIESLVNPQLSSLKPVLIPHHKGRKRMHLELKETMARVGADLKQKFIDSVRSTWNSVYQLAMFKNSPNQTSFEEEVNKALEEQLVKKQTVDCVEETEEQTDLSLGILNGGRRIDYVLQEAPFEFFNEYVFALTSHVCYWVSEDTMLLILKEIYESMQISPDSQIPQQTMTIERPPSSPKSYRYEASTSYNQSVNLGMDPTIPKKSNSSLGPPPTSGFVRKT